MQHLGERPHQSASKRPAHGLSFASILPDTGRRTGTGRWIHPPYPTTTDLVVAYSHSHAEWPGKGCNNCPKNHIVAQLWAVVVHTDDGTTFPCTTGRKHGHCPHMGQSSPQQASYFVWTISRSVSGNCLHTSDVSHTHSSHECVCTYRQQKFSPHQAHNLHCQTPVLGAASL